MSQDHAAEIDRHVRIYIAVFVSLMVLTLATVGAWKYLDLGIGMTIAVALFIATIKAGLVACFFMHLISEKKLIYSVMVLTVFFFLVLLLVPFWTSIAGVITNS
jgi:cytochrome c oxidase subunit 4